MTEGSLTDKFLAKAKKALEIGSEAADVLVHLQHGASPIGLAAVGMRVINSVREHRAKTPEEHFSDWKQVDLGLLATQTLTALRSDSNVTCDEVPGIHEYTPALITRVDGLEIGWGIEGSLKKSSVRVNSVWMRTDAVLKPLLQRVGRALWTHVGGSQVCLTIDSTSSVKLVAEDDTEILPSIKGDELYKRIQKFQTKGLRRSFFIIGKPGVGKSCLLRYIASLQGGFRLRLRMSKLDGFNPDKLIRIVEILRPNVLVIDDFDRYVMGKGRHREQKESAEGQAMLDPLDTFDKIVPLVLVSANYSEAITPAVLRPGRFAEMITIEEVDPEVYAKMLPEAPESMIKQLKRLKVPIAYLEEIKQRAEALGYAETAKEIPQLVKRADLILVKNTKAMKNRKRKKSTLVGKTPGQKAVMLDHEGSSLDKRATHYAATAAKLRARAEKRREQATVEREKAKAKKIAKKKTSKKKTKRRSTSAQR